MVHSPEETLGFFEVPWGVAEGILEGRGLILRYLRVSQETFIDLYRSIQSLPDLKESF